MQKPPQTFYIPLERRRFLKSLALISAGFTVPGYLAEALTLTPQVTQGPFYPLATNTLRSGDGWFTLEPSTLERLDDSMLLIWLDFYS